MKILVGVEGVEVGCHLNVRLGEGCGMNKNLPPPH